MATRAQVCALLEAGQSYESIGRALGLPAGLAYMLATGAPADAGGPPPPETPGAAPSMPGSQRLVGTPAVNPTRNRAVLDWVRRRAARDLEAPG